MQSKEIMKGLRANINNVFVGKEDVVENVLICLLAGGHILLEDVPGVGKTTLALALAKSMEGSFGRIQFTPDTLPSDVVGVSVYREKTGKFEFMPGPVMNHVLLGDEINRTSPKTQASLLEAMAEGQVTVDGNVFVLPKPFLVIATQNPKEFMGTYPLPEAQLDRFMMRLTIGYPEREQEIKMAEAYLNGNTPDKVKPVCSAKDILMASEEVKKVLVKENILSYIEEMVSLTREDEKISLGASPRAMLALVRASQAKAFLEGRDYVKPDDVRAVAKHVLGHRIVLSQKARLQMMRTSQVLEQIIVKAKIPM